MCAHRRHEPHWYRMRLPIPTCSLFQGNVLKLTAVVSYSYVHYSSSALVVRRTYVRTYCSSFESPSKLTMFKKSLLRVDFPPDGAENVCSIRVITASFSAAACRCLCLSVCPGRLSDDPPSCAEDPRPAGRPTARSRFVESLLVPVPPVFFRRRALLLPLLRGGLVSPVSTLSPQSSDSAPNVESTGNLFPCR